MVSGGSPNHTRNQDWKGKKFWPQRHLFPIQPVHLDGDKFHSTVIPFTLSGHLTLTELQPRTLVRSFCAENIRGFRRPPSIASQSSPTQRPDSFVHGNQLVVQVLIPCFVRQPDIVRTTCSRESTYDRRPSGSPTGFKAHAILQLMPGYSISQFT